MATDSTKILDHIVHLTSPGTLQDSIDAFRKLGFTVIPGGTHASGLTANALVVFADGTYLELLHFIQPPTLNTTHSWAKKKPGWIDFAFLGNQGTPSFAATINARAEADGSSVRYEAEVKGGRTREDGKFLEWIVSGRELGVDVRGRLPFFCGDLTPREWRVPLVPRSNTVHENTATGVAYVKLLVASEDFEVAVRDLTSVLGTRSSTGTQATWNLDKQPTYDGASTTTTTLIVSAAQDDEERVHVQEHGPGVYEVGFFVAQKGFRDGVTVTKTPYGRILWKVAKSQ